MLELYRTLGLLHYHEVPGRIKVVLITPFTNEQIKINKDIEHNCQVVNYFAEVPVEQTLL